MKRKYDIIWLESTDSTNNEIIRKIDSLDNMSVVAAMEQSAGRGQRGNKWTSKPGENLTFSILLRFGGESLPVLGALDQFVLSEVATLSLIDFLSLMDINAKIKWSNDIYVGDKKISGMLIENSLHNDKVATSVIGIGLNVNQVEFPEDIPNPISISQITGTKHDCRKLLPQYMDIFERYLAIATRSGGLEKIRILYTGMMYRKDETHTYTDLKTGQTFEGIIKGISDIGLLQIEDLNGDIREYGFKEIKFEISNLS